MQYLVLLVFSIAYIAIMNRSYARARDYASSSKITIDVDFDKTLVKYLIEFGGAFALVFVMGRSVKRATDRIGFKRLGQICLDNSRD